MTSSVTVRDINHATTGTVPNQLTGIIEAKQPLREREFHTGVVLNWTIRDKLGDSIRIFAFDDWANALVFAAVGDELTLKGFRVIQCPQDELSATSGPVSLSPARNGHQSPPRGTQSQGYHQSHYFLVPTEQSEVVVAQEAEQNDVIEFLVTPSDFENPVCKVRKNLLGQPATNSMVLSNDVPGGRTLRE